MLIEELEKRILKIASLKLSNQPFIVVVGTLHNIKEIMIRIDDNTYKVKSIIEAIDLLFKIFYVMNVEYPFACRSTWTFIQEFFYKIPTASSGKKKAKKFVTVVNLINKLKNMNENDNIELA